MTAIMKLHLILVALAVLLVSAYAAPASPYVAVVNSTRLDTTPNVGLDQYALAYTYFSNGSAAGNQYCSMSLYRWSANNSNFMPVGFYDTKKECLTPGVYWPDTYDCSTYSDPAGEVYIPFKIDEAIFLANDVGKVEMHCGNATDSLNFTVANFREPTGMAGEVLAYFIAYPEAIFGIFIFAMLLVMVLVVCVFVPYQIFKGIFG
jgi:hypothetical protein